MRNAGLDEAQAGIKIAGRNISNLRYADDTTLMAESEEELKILLMKVKEESEKAGLKFNIQKKKNIMASGPISSVQSLSRVWLCDPVDCSMPVLPVHHQLPEFTQTHIHRMGDAIQPSHPLLSSFSSRFQSFPASGSFPMSHFFESGDQSIGASASVLPMNIHDWFPFGLTGLISMQSMGLSTPQFKRINSSALSFLYSPILTSIHDHWKNHSFD